MKKAHMINIVLLIIFTIFIVPKGFQNDTFYSIPIGNEIIENGIIHDDIFSEHENLRYETPHWLFDVMTSLFYRLGGLDAVFIMVLISASIFGITFYLILCSKSKSIFLSLLTTILLVFLLSSYFTGRAQVVTYTLLILEYFLLDRIVKTGKKKYVFLTVLIVILASNLHVAFSPFFIIFFLPYIAEDILNHFSVSKMVKSDLKKAKKKIEKLESNSDANNEAEIERQREIIRNSEEYLSKNSNDCGFKEGYKVIVEYEKNIKLIYITLILCVLAIMINPYGVMAYTYTIKTLMGISVKFIAEHTPSVVLRKMGFVVSLVIFFAFLGFTEIKIKQKDAFYCLGLLLYALKAYKGIPLFVIMSLLVISPLIIDYTIKHGIDLVGFDKKFYNSKMMIVSSFVLVCITSFSNFLNQYKAPFVPDEMYPTKAVMYIKQNLDIANIKLYNNYNYGSYLIFNGLNPFIDSRADLYCKEFNEDCSVFQDYYDVYVNKMNLKELEKKYKFTHFLIENQEDIYKYYLENGHYALIYEDENFLLYEALDR